MKKLLAFLLTFLMIFNLACLPASAEVLIAEEEPAEETVLGANDEAVSIPPDEETAGPIDVLIEEEEESVAPADALAPTDEKEALKEGSVDVSSYVLQVGGWLPDAPEGCLAMWGDQDAALKQTIYYGLCAWQEWIDIAEYCVSPEEIGPIFQSVINDNPDLFYVTGGFNFYGDYSRITSISPWYDYSYSDADVADYRATVHRIVGMLEADWSDVEKLLFLHDYLVTHCEYDLSYQGHNAYDALVLGSAVCQGYSLAFNDLCRTSGITSSVISSAALYHAWNLVSFDGENYYVDCTWDDPANGLYEAYCAHRNFLLSRDSFASNHNSTDWTDSTTNVYWNVETSSRYDYAWWRDNVITAIPHIGHIGAFAYYDEDLYMLLMDLNSGDYCAPMLPGFGRWPVWGSSYASWGNYSSVAALNGLFYFTMPTEIWSLSPSGDMNCVYKLTASELSQGYLYGIISDGDTLWYSIGTQPYGGNFTRAAFRPGVVVTDALVRDGDGVYRVYRDGVFYPMTGFIEYEGGLFCVQDGILNSSANGLVNDPNNTSVWYFCANGQVALQYSGLAEYGGEWFYLSNGVLDTTSVGIVNYNGGRFIIAAGRILRNVNGLIQDPNTGIWYYVSSGQVVDYTGLALYNGSWFYVENGLLAVNYTGWVSYNGSKFYVVNGQVKSTPKEEPDPVDPIDPIDPVDPDTPITADSPLTRDNILRLLDEIDPDGAFIIRNSDDMLSYWFGSATTIGEGIDSLATAVHEQCHDYCNSPSGSRYNSVQGKYMCAKEWIYIGDGQHIEVLLTDVFPSSEMVDTVPESLRTFRFNTYVNGDPITSSIQYGPYGMLDEFTAYCWGNHNEIMQKGFREENNLQERGYSNNYVSYAEFRYYILHYMLYAKEHYPEVYSGILNNSSFRQAFTVIDNQFAGFAETQNNHYYDSEWNPLMTEMQKPEYVNMANLLKS